MKNTYILIIALVSMIGFTSCETDYDTYETERQDVVGLVGIVGSGNVSLAPGASVDKEIEVFVSNVSTVERSYAFELNTDLTTVSADNFSFNSQFVMPAGTRRTTIMVTITNNSFPVEYADSFFKILDSPDYVTGAQVKFRVRLAP